MKKIKLLALVSAIITVISLFFFLNTLRQPATVHKTGVLVAVRDIPSNTQVTKDMVTVKNVPSEAVGPSVVTDINWVVGKLAQSDIAAGEQLISTKFVEAGKSGTGALAYSIKPGMRAVTIAVNDISGLSGMLKPGNNVDVVALFSDDKNNLKYTKMILQNVTVLAVDSVTSEKGKTKNKDGTSASYASITLQVTPLQAMDLSLSEYTGKLKAILRSPLDGENANLPVVTMNDLK